jgi:hypothetical protein
MQTVSGQKNELDKLIDQKLSDEFDGIIFNDICSKLGSSAKHLTTGIEYFFGSHPFVLRSIKVDLLQKMSFSKELTAEGRNRPAEIQIEGSSPQCKHRFSMTDLCSIFLPEHKFEVTKDWKKTLRANLEVLNSDMESLYEREISVSISGEDPKSQVSNFWGHIETTPRHKFYALAYPILKFIVSRAVPEISIAARWGSDSPYQRFLKSDHWSLLSFRISKRQQIDIAQYSELKKIKLRCALLDLGFLENGYGKVAKIKELISVEIPNDSTTDKISSTQAEFFTKALKQISELVK